MITDAKKPYLHQTSSCQVKKASLSVFKFLSGQLKMPFYGLEVISKMYSIACTNTVKQPEARGEGLSFRKVLDLWGLSFRARQLSGLT